MSTIRGMGGALSFALVFGLVIPAAFADEAADRCGADKLKAAGRFGQAVLGCEAKAARAGESVDAACVSAAAGNITESFTRAEGRGGCATVDDAAAVAVSVEADAAGIAAALAPDPVDAARICASSKMKAAGKHYSATLLCWFKSAKQSEGPDPTCLDRATQKLTIAFTKAESKGGCTTTGDSPDIAVEATAAILARAASISPVCGDGVVGPDQECELTADAACPGLCNAACACEFPPECGDGVAELPEECDDSNLDDLDGCSSTCELEDASSLCDGVATSPGTALDAVLVSDAIDQPIHAAAPRLDPARLFVVERPGRIRIVELSTDALRPTAFLDIADEVNTAGEGGLLSMAFHPDYENNRRFFVNYTNLDGDTTIARYEASVGDPNVVDEASARVLLVIDQPFSNHNGGQIAFGADGYLYVGMGDGGGGGDPLETAQDDSSLLGKMLRLDVDVDVPPYHAVPVTNPGYVDGSSSLELIWAKGLRNPWRFSFDRATGDALIADVGQSALEEVDFQSGASTGGENYGWDIFEGSQCFEPDPAPTCPVPPTGFTMPIHEYSHASGCSITGGFVYRGCAVPALAGAYFHSDFCSARVRTFTVGGGTPSAHQDRTGDLTSTGVSFDGVLSFGEDARGELYIADFSGLYRIVPE